MNLKSTNTLIVAAAVAVALGSAAAAQAFELDKVTARVRAIHISPADKNDPIAAIGVPKDSLDVESKWAPDIDFEYALRPNIGVELLLTIPQKHSVIARQTVLGNNVNLGTVTHLPPTLTGKYYFLTDNFRPYVGAGVNFTWFTSSKLAVPTVGTLKTDSASVGGALQAGFDYSLNDNWSLSFDAKRVWINTDVKLNGTKLTTVDVNPWILGVGIGYRFNRPAPAPLPQKVAVAPPPPPPPAAVAPPPPPPPPPPPRDSDRDGVVDTADNCPNTPAGVKVDARGCEIVITLKGVNFETSSAKLTPDSVAILDQAVAVLKQRAGSQVEVQGHTDSRGKDALNLTLSQKRAESVRAYLVKGGIDAARLTAKGYGETAPVASNDSDEGRAQNRRVDLKFATP
jgi:outer membrane protein W/outer membrane protein OmpA-like peptidoglycan-associated protein